jgi:hypothetical protein
MSAPSFSKDIPNKIGENINVSGKNTLIKAKKNCWNVAIADEPIDAKVDGKKFFCVRVDRVGMYSAVMIGFTLMETFDSNKTVCFGNSGFTGCGIFLSAGDLRYPVNKSHDIIDENF